MNKLSSIITLVYLIISLLAQNNILAQTCSHIDFLELKDKQLQREFFFKLDSIRKVQYPNSDQETSIAVDLTPEYLDRFLNNINEDSLNQDNGFLKEYHFNIAPKGHIDPKECKDKIQLKFEKNSCQFRLAIINTFLVESNWCKESMVVYWFKITELGISNFGRNEAG